MTPDRPPGDDAPGNTARRQRGSGPHHRGVPRIILLMGVSGSGKSTTARRLASALDWPHCDADSFHPPANIAKMRAGKPLTDDDRWPWLAAIANWIDGQRAIAATGIVACSALKRRYRDILIGDRPDVGLVYLQGGFSLIAARLSRRRGHFMPPQLLHSQFEALEEPQADEAALVVSMRLPPKLVVERIACGFGLSMVRRIPPLPD